MSPYSVAVRIYSVSPFVLSDGGGDEGIRTLDPLRARQVLSQLSYTPVFLRAIAVLILLLRFREYICTL